MLEAGLFKKEICSICGQPKGLLGAKPGDENCLCSKCQDTGTEYAFYRIDAAFIASLFFL